MFCHLCGKELTQDAKFCHSCGSVIPNTALAGNPQQQVITQSKPAGVTDTNVVYFSTTGIKIALLSVTTFGLYQLYWFYKNWDLFKLATGRKISPSWRAVLAIFNCHSLFTKVLYSAKLRGYPETYSTLWLSVLYIGLSILGGLPNPWWLISMFSFLPLLEVQQAINFNNSRVSPNYQEKSQLTLCETLVAVIGGILSIVVLIVAFAAD